MRTPQQKPLVDELLDEYFPEESYNARIREKAKSMTLVFFESARKEYALQEQINLSILLGRELTEDEKMSILKRWGFVI